jgi:ATP/maltotriose-dependent transcriptional regulator MalT
VPAKANERDAVNRSSVSGPVILQTKLARPPVRAEHVVRSELLEFLREGASRRLTLLTAPPGFGKTTLLAEWAAAEEGRAVAWLSLEDADNDPTRFLAYLIESLRSVEPDIGGHALAAHSAPGAGVIDVVLPLLLNDLAALETGIVLVLDDYHVITNPDIHEALGFLVDRLPESLRLILATREDPPLPLARLRARGDLGELRAAELRFSAEEAKTFLNDVLDLGLSEEDIGRLQERTEGWPAALYLAALSMRGRADPRALIDRFAGDDRHLVDYLTGEVLARQPPELRSFLLRTSILTRVCGPLCDVVTDRDDSALILGELERSNLLLMPLDNKREWYRYHPLLAELLQRELERTDPSLLPKLHRRASAWHRDAGLIVEAAGHATAAGDVAIAVELVGRHIPLFLDQRHLATVSRWLDALPAHVIAENWQLCLGAVMVASHTSRLDEAERWLEAAERAAPLVRNGQAPDGPVGASRAWLRLLRGDIDGTIAAARRALTAAPAPSAEPVSRFGPQLLLGIALWWSGQATEGKTVLEAATSTAEAAELAAGTIFTLGLRAAIELDEGNAPQAEELAGEAAALTDRAELEEHPFTAMAHLVRGAVHGRRGQLSEAKEMIERGIQLAERVRSWFMTAYGLLALAEIRHRENDAAAARRLLARARGVLETLPDPGPGLSRLEQTEKALRLRAARRREAARAPFWELSERELVVLRLLASRLSQREIAAELYVSFNTVKSHTRSIFRKLGVGSRAEAVDRAREHGLL